MTLYPDLVNAMGDVNVQVNGPCFAMTDEPILQVAEFKVTNTFSYSYYRFYNLNFILAVYLQSKKRRHRRMQNGSLLPVGHQIGLFAS